MRNFFVLVILFCFSSECLAQTITTDNSYVYTSNIDYKSYNSFTFPNLLATGSSVGVMGLILTDAGGDGKSTTISSIKFTFLPQTGSALKAAALYVGTSKVANTSTTVSIKNDTTDITFTKSTGLFSTILDGASINFELRVTFKKSVIVDNQQLLFTVDSVTTLSAGSSLSSYNGGGATSSIAGNTNKLAVTATKYSFSTQPSDVFAGQVITPFVTVKAVDLNNNVDSDYTSQIKLNLTNATPFCDSLSGNILNAVSGIATFPALSSNVAEDSVSLYVTGNLVSVPPVASNKFTVNSAQYNALIYWNFSDGNNITDGGMNLDSPVKNIITTTASGTILFADCGCNNSKGKSATATGWDNGKNSKAWQIDFMNTGYWNITVAARHRSSPTGPKDMKVQYRLSNTSWTDIGTIPAMRGDSFKVNTSSFEIPAIDTPARVYVRWVMYSDSNSVGGLVDAAAQNDIDEIKVEGIGTTLAKQLYYRSSGSGDFESSCTWDSSVDSLLWSQAKGSPDFSSYGITIQTGHTVVINETIKLDQITIQPGATLILNAGDLHILNGGKISGLNVQGTFIDNATIKDGVTFSSDGTWRLGSSGTFIKTNNSPAKYYRDKYSGGMSSIPSTANWIIRYTGANSPTFTTDSTYYPNLTFESTSGAWSPSSTDSSCYFRGTSANGAFATVKGNLDIGGTGSGTVKISNVSPNNQPLLVTGDAIIRSGNELNNAIGTGTGTGFEIKGNLTVNGILAMSGTGTVKLSGSSAQTLSGAGTINLQNFTVANSGSGVTLTRDLTVGATDSLIQGVLNPGTYTLTLKGAIVRTAGSINASQNTTVFSGSSAQIIPANIFLNNIIKNLTISNGVTLNGEDSITGILNLTGNNNIFTTNNFLTLKSTATGTANVGKIANNCSVSGNVTVERFVSAKRAWRFLSIPTNTIQTIKEAWQEGATLSTDDPKPGYGTQITDNNSNNAVLLSSGFDYYSPDGPSLKKYNSVTNKWVSVTSTNNIPAGSGLINTTEGLMVFVRGGRRSIGFNATSYVTVLRTKGTLKSGPQTPIIVGDNKFVSVGNPYASAIDLRQLTKTAGVSDVFTVWDPNLTGSQGVGAYQYLYKSGSDYLALLPGGSYGNGTHNYIESGQAFFAQGVSGGGGGNITFDENAKADSNTNPLVFRSSSLPFPKLRTNLYVIENNETSSLVDGTLSEFGDKYDNKIDKNDVLKLTNTAENFALRNGDALLAIQRKQKIVKTDTLFFNMQSMKEKIYNLEFIATDFSEPGQTAFLEDSYTKSLTPIALQGKTIYAFNVIDQKNSWNPDRFKVVFASEEKAGSGIVLAKLKAYQKDRNISVDWSIETEKNIKQYQIEKSVNGLQFDVVNSVVARYNNLSGKYQWLDENPSETNYYRIKIIAITGQVQYSEVAKVSIANGTITLYPNPVVNGIINLQLVLQPKGTYQIRLINKLGQVVQVKSINHGEGSSTEKLLMNKNLSRGAYHLEVTKPDNSKQNIHLWY